MRLNLPLPPSKQPRTIDAGELKRLASEIGNRKEIAKALKMNYSQFCWKVTQSATLDRHLKEGLAKFKENEQSK